MVSLDEITAQAGAFRSAVRERQAFIPLYVKLKLAFTCNLRCQMCNHWREARRDALPMERFRQLLDELARLGCRKIHLSGGEPLLRPGVVDLVAHATELDIRVTMTTNGTLVTKEKARALVKAGLRGVNVSIDSPRRKVHEQVRGVEGSWKKATRAAEYFTRYADKGKLTVRINTVVSRINYTTLGEMPDFAHGLGVDALNLIGVDLHTAADLQMHRADVLRYNAFVAPTIAERGLALGLINREDQAYPFGRSTDQTHLARHGEYAFGWYREHPCFAPWTHSLVDYNGKVYLCCMTREQTAPLGDLTTQTFEEIWRGPGYQTARGMMQPPALKQCRSCDDFTQQNRALEALLTDEAIS